MVFLISVFITVLDCILLSKNYLVQAMLKGIIQKSKIRALIFFLIPRLSESEKIRLLNM